MTIHYWLYAFLFENPQFSTVLLGAIIGVLTLINGWNWYKREDIRRLKDEKASLFNAVSVAETTVAFYKEQKEITDEKIIKLEHDKIEQAKRITTLEAKTDLESVRILLNNNHAETLAALKRESTETQLQIMQIIQSTVKEIMTGFAEHAKRDLENQNQMVTAMKELKELFASDIQI